jgi:hypothetical protein
MIFGMDSVVAHKSQSDAREPFELGEARMKPSHHHRWSAEGGQPVAACKL